MKALKLIIINALTLIIGLGLLTGSLSSRSATATRFENIPSLKVGDLGKYQGQYLTILYAVGSRPLISKDNSEIHISQVKESRTLYITDDLMRTLPVQVEKEGFRPSYNIVVFVVSEKPNYSWLNADGTIPQGLTSTNNHESSLINTINRSAIESMSSKHTDLAKPIAISLRR